MVELFTYGDGDDLVIIEVIKWDNDSVEAKIITAADLGNYKDRAGDAITVLDIVVLDDTDAAEVFAAKVFEDEV